MSLKYIMGLSSLYRNDHSICMTVFAGKYRIESARLPSHDYTEPGKYFVTICTKNRECWFGEIRNGIMGLSDVGCVIVEEIQRTSSVRLYADVIRYVVMPNHVHIIVHIKLNHDCTIVETHRRCVSTDIILLIGLPKRKPNALGSIIAQIKCVCTKRIRNMGYIDFAWQPRFHDRIIRDDHMLKNIRHYIDENPAMWSRDRNNHLL